MTAKRFVVIEPSIKSQGGHYLQYALHVLRAAANEGFKPVLAGHRQFTVRPIDDVEVAPAFTNVFFHRFADAPGSRNPLSRLYFEFIRVRNGIALRFTAYWYFTRAYVGLANTVGPVASNRFVRIAAVVVFFPIAIAWRLWRSGPVVRARTALHKWLFGMPEALHDASNSRAIRQLTDDLLALRERLQPAKGDHLLMATASGAELLALMRAIKREPRMAAPTWHLVFRRNVRIHPTAAFVRVDLEVRLGRISLKAWEDAPETVRLYTDTDALTGQYNALAGKSVFRTLPIPHLRERASPPSPSPCVISYQGDARPEKGYQFLSRIAEAVRPTLLATGKARFRLQSNFNIAGGEPECVMARKELEKFPSEQVELLTEAQSEDAYWANLETSGIVLIPYEASSYSERSSGIFAECVAMETPVIVPAGTWMSRQLAAFDYPKIAALYRQASPADPASTQIIAGGVAPELLNPLEDRWFCPGEEPRFTIAANCPPGAAQVLVKVTLRQRWFARVQLFERDEAGALVRFSQRLLEAADPDGETEALLLHDLHEHTRRLQVVVLNCTLASFAHPDDFGLAFSTKPLSYDSPGEVYFDWTEIPSLLERMTPRIERYRAAMREFAPAFREYHCGSSFLSILLRSDKP
ncbi:MAG: hypothetical protein HYR64_05360 [Fimbriimonas ginsengisoli]|uniref:Uncharacterized protein n=1 Tax=Fimbriimonas ginsengisoli TaxID=1005039 RepID=A0A931LVL7_FIMGI|nr:hypothetical protein [Fimbriimonas ginsengisoli]